MGLTMGLSVALATWAGMWLDRRLGTHKVFTLVGVALGAAAAGRELYRATKLALRSMDEGDDPGER